MEPRSPELAQWSLGGKGRQMDRPGRRLMSMVRRIIPEIPNVLTCYRLLMAPVLVVLALYDQRSLFVVFLCISFVTDALDGPIARALNLRTELGARLDSIADLLTYLAALVGILHFEWQALRPHVPMLYVFMAMLLLAILVPLVRYRSLASFHLYSSKLNALLLALFIIYFLTRGFSASFYYFALGLGIVAFAEIIAVALILEKPINDAKGLYWVMRHRKTGP